MELIALSGIALLTAILVSRAVGTAAIQWAVTEAYSGTKYEDKTEEVLKDLDQFIEKHKVTEYRIIGCLGTKAERCVCDVLPEY